jgi:hypothetical protein
MAIFLPATKRAASAAPPAPFAAEMSDANREMINMEEMQIHGNINKPNIMYVIPRADLKIEMKLHDEYFLPAATFPNAAQPQSAENEEISPFNEDLPLKEPLPCSFDLKARSLFYIDKPEIKEGSCVVCHYPAMALPQGVPAARLTKELNQSCIHCHPSRYYHICWKEVEKGISQPPGQDKSNCRKCHTPWTQQQGIDSTEEKTQGTWAKGAGSPWHWNQPREIQQKEKETHGKGLSKQGYDTDTFCTTCHKY